MKVADTGTLSKDKEWIRLIDDASKKCLSLITELLESDLEVREEHLQRAPLDLAHLLPQAILLLVHRANEKGQKIIIAEGDAGIVMADWEKLSRVIENLVINAIKFSPEGATITLGSMIKGEEAVLSVQDNGVGIPEDMAARLFEPFGNHVRRKGTAGEPSYGLGLYICRQIVAAHGGKIWFESKAGKGTIFYISLPRVQAV
jgi:signal transduction histidine kinase